VDALFEIDDRDVLGGWTGRRVRRRAASLSAPTTQGLRFGFYGRTSTVEFQDPVTSRAWQREMAEVVIAGRGVITTEFFDVGCSRRVPWDQQTEAAALLEQARSADRQFDAVVVGEFERAFTERQFEQVAGMLRRFGVRVWLPEAGGPGRAGRSGAPSVDEGVGSAVAAGGGAGAASDVGSDDGADRGAGPVPGRSSAVRIQVG
jgi:hypothetical protein